MTSIEVGIPVSKCGLIIGKKGETIKRLKEKMDVEMMFNQHQQNNQVTMEEQKLLHISGAQDKVEMAKRIIKSIITGEVKVPRSSAGIIIGKSGETIKRICHETGARIQFQPDDPNSQERCANILQGTPEQICHAMQKISELVTRNTGGSEKPPKYEYDSPEKFMKKAWEHLNTGDYAQCCEKLSSGTKFAIKTFVDELMKKHSKAPIPIEMWNQEKYTNVCLKIHKAVGHSFIQGWQSARDFHVQGWNQDLVNYEEAKIGIHTIQKFIKRIQNLTNNHPDLASKEEFVLEIRDVFYHDFINPATKASNMVAHFEAGNHKGALGQLGVNVTREQELREKIVEEYGKIYEQYKQEGKENDKLAPPEDLKKLI